MAQSRSYRLFRSIMADSSGVGLIELAFILPILLLLILGTIDLSRFVAARLDLEQAAQRTTDYALALRPTNANGTYLKNEAVAASGVPAANVTVDIFLECDGVRQSSFNNTCASGETRARYVSVSIVEQVQPIFDWASLSNFLGFSGFSSEITVTGDSLVRFQ
jgi:Flp pilus assembly protein TadG